MRNVRKNNDKNRNEKFKIYLIITLIGLAIIFMITKVALSSGRVVYQKVFDTPVDKSKIIKESYKDFKQELEDSKIAMVDMKDDDIIYYTKMKDGMENVVNTDKNELLDEAIYMSDNPKVEGFREKILLAGAEIYSKKDNKVMLNASSPVLFMTIGFLAIYFYTRKKAFNEAFVQEPGSKLHEESSKVTFKSVAGNDEAKESLMDIVDFLKEPAKYAKSGARMPKGIIFYGAPGTGKTLMAKALANEASANFYSVSGSDFVEMYVGVGASRIRQLFKKAKERGKAVIFIDEIDALGRKRMSSKASSNEERDQTLNALLCEMSGFKESDEIVVVAATNRIDILDEALLRPGRFDRQIEITLPDKNARLAILNVHKKGKIFASDVDFRKVAEETVYFSGAMLENMLNEAAINAVKEGESAISNSSLEKAYYGVLVGAEKKDKSFMTKEEKKIIAVHEAGHTLVRKILEPESKISKVSILPTVKGAGGYTACIRPDTMFTTRLELKNEICVLLAGRCAEEIVLGSDKVTTGASNDLEKVSTIVKDFVTRYGMKDLKYLYYQDSSCDNSQEVKEVFDQMITSSAKETNKIIIDNFECFKKLVKALLKSETLKDEDINMIIFEEEMKDG